MKKQGIVIFIFFCMALGISYGQSSTGIWTIEKTEGGCILTGYNGSDTDIIIPSKWGGLAVLSIGDGVFQNKNLTSVAIPTGVVNIGSYAFANNQIERISMPSTVISIGKNAFMGNKLTRITLSSNLKIIGMGAFAKNQLISITLPESIENIEGNPFYGNSNLLQIVINDKNQNYMSLDGILFSKNKKTLVAYPAGKGAITEIPSGVTALGARALSDAHLTTIIIPVSIETIEDNALTGNDLISITIPKNLTIYGASFDNDFINYYNRGGKTGGIYIYKNGNWSFFTDTDEMLDVDFTEEGIAITGYKGYGGVLELPSTLDGFPVVSIETGALRAKGLVGITVPSSVTVIGNGAFAGNNLKTITIPSNVVFIGGGAFAGNPLDNTTYQTIQKKYGEATLVYQIGDIGPAGGFIFYDKGNNSDGWRYLEAAPASTEDSTFISFSCNRAYSTITDANFGAGFNNTKLVLAALDKKGITGNTAYKICDTLVINGYNDWYCPSLNELKMMYQNLFLKGIGDFQRIRYWSSTFFTEGNQEGLVYAVNFSNGKSGSTTRENDRVRACRRF